MQNRTGGPVAVGTGLLGGSPNVGVLCPFRHPSDRPPSAGLLDRVIAIPLSTSCLDPSSSSSSVSTGTVGMTVTAAMTGEEKVPPPTVSTGTLGMTVTAAMTVKRCSLYQCLQIHWDWLSHQRLLVNTLCGTPSLFDCVFSFDIREYKSVTSMWFPLGSFCFCHSFFLSSSLFL